jgi:hypothetical protein
MFSKIGIYCQGYVHVGNSYIMFTFGPTTQAIQVYLLKKVVFMSC